MHTLRGGLLETKFATQVPCFCFVVERYQENTIDRVLVGNNQNLLNHTHQQSCSDPLPLVSVVNSQHLKQYKTDRMFPVLVINNPNDGVRVNRVECNDPI